MNRFILSIRIIAVVAFGLAADLTHAASKTWFGPAGSVWDNGVTPSWGSGATTWTNGDDATFGTNGAGSVVIDGINGVAANSVTVNAAGYVISGGTLTFGAVGTITFSTAITPVISSVIGGAGTSLTLDSDNVGGYLVLTGGNAYTGDTIVSGRNHNNYSSSPSLVLSNVTGAALQSTNVYVGRAVNSGHATIWCKANNQFGNTPLLYMNQSDYAFLDLFGTTQTVAGVQGFNGTAPLACIENTANAGSAGMNGLLTINTPSGSTYSCTGIFREYNGSAGTLGLLAITKDGPGTQKLTSNNGSNLAWYGPTTVKAGRFEVEGLANSPTWNLQGGTLAVVRTANANVNQQVTLLTSTTGSGTLEVNMNQSSDALNPFYTTSAKTISLGTGSLIYVKRGVLQVGTYGYNATWTNNKAGLTLDGNASFDMGATPTTGTSPVFDALNGSGTITDTAGTNILSVGVAGGSGTFSGTITQGVGSLVGFKKVGTGTQTLSGVSTYTGSTLIQGGTLALGVANPFGGSTNIILANNATVDVSAVAYTLPAWQKLQGTGCVAGAVSTAAGSLIAGGNNAPGDTLTFLGDLALASGATNWFDLNGTNADMVTVQGTLLPNNGWIGIIVNQAVTNGTYRLVNYGSVSDGWFAGLVNTSRKTVTLDTNTAGQVNVVVSGSGAGADLTWSPLSGGAWDVGVSSNWYNTGLSAPDVYFNQDAVTFSDSGSGAPDVTLDMVARPSAVTVNSSADYTIHGAGRISGPTGITKSGAGGLILATGNDFNGAIVWGASNGFICVANSTALSTGSVSVATGSALQLSNNVTVANALTISGGGVNNDGALRNVAGSNIYAGVVTVLTNVGISADGGLLTLSKSIVVGAATVASVGGAGNVVLNGGISGAGTLTKLGLGTVTLPGVTTAYTGATIVNAGRLTLLTPTRNVPGGGGYVISNSATLEINAAADCIFSGERFTGSGTFVKTGGAKLYLGWAGSPVNMNMTGGLIDVQAGILGGGYNDPDWSNNKASLNVTNGAIADLWGSLSGMIVDALTGGGTVQKSYASVGTNLVVGINNGSGTFGGTIINQNGLAFVKAGLGTQTLTGGNTYAGGTVVSNGVLLVNNGTGSGTGSGPVNVVNGTLGGTGTVAGAINVLNGAAIAPGALTNAIGTLKIMTNATLQAGAVFAVQLATNGLCDQVVYSGSNTATFTVSGAILSGSLLDDGEFIRVGARYVLLSAPVITGTFSNCPAGSRIKIGPKAFVISYPGQTNVVLTVAESGLLLMLQ